MNQHFLTGFRASSCTKIPSTTSKGQPFIFHTCSSKCRLQRSCTMLELVQALHMSMTEYITLTDYRCSMTAFVAFCLHIPLYNSPGETQQPSGIPTDVHLCRCMHMAGTGHKVVQWQVKSAFHHATTKLITYLSIKTPCRCGQHAWYISPAKLWHTCG